jgi:light-regulated signal transduction histidine kinase (bacteriophytochrome)
VERTPHLAVAATAAALLLRPWLEPNMTLPFVAAVAVTAWMGGKRPGLLALALSTLAFFYFFIPPERAWGLADIQSFTRTVAFVCVLALIVWLIETIRREEVALRASEERFRAQAAELAQSNAELEQFAYIASHDLQEPLRMVASYTQLLAERYRGRLDADADEFIGYASGGARRMQTLINDLLQYSRLGRRPLALQPVRVADAVRDALQNLKPAVEESDAEVNVSDLPVVTADAPQFVQLFQNLIGNAIKFHGSEPPRVEIAAEPSDGRWIFSVRDNGIGIDPRYADRIFGMFQRLHSKERYPGTGIGLAVARKIVERHGGEIWVESRPAEGSLFRFTVPIRENKNAS